VGGIRKGDEMISVIDSGESDIIGISRPFVCEPDLVRKLKHNPSYISNCINCNFCAIMCDSGQPTRCYQTGGFL
jgi:2,4-dienoyl-CoA reductase-like NADH-dependent reductase (Old Yellow Enzyme family)